MKFLQRKKLVQNLQFVVEWESIMHATIFSQELESQLRQLAQDSEQLQPIATDCCADSRPLAGIKAVLFDIYGTLLISQTGDISIGQKSRKSRITKQELSPLLQWLNEHYQLEDLVYQKILERHGIAHRQGVKYPEVDILDIWLHILKDCLPAKEQKRWSLELSTIALLAMEYELLVNKASLMPHCKEVLELLKAAGLLLGIVSNAQFYTLYTFEALAESSLKELGFRKELCSWSFEQKVGKPNLRIFLLPLRLLHAQGIEAEQVLFVGNDLKKDIEPAQKLGMKTALFVGDQRSLRLYRHDPVAQELRADRYLTSIDQLAEVLSL